MSQPPPTPPVAVRPRAGAVPRRSAGADVASVVALVAGAVGACVLVVVGFTAALCGESGDRTCTRFESEGAFWMVLAGPVLFLATPVVVAAVRRDARWLLALVAEVVAAGAALALLQAVNTL